MQMMKQPGQNAGAEVRLRTMRIIWVVFLTAIGLFVLVTHMAHTDSPLESGGSVPPLLYVLGAAGLASVAISFPLKANYYRRAAEQQQPALLQMGFALALAFCEVAVLLGVAGAFATHHSYAYALFALGALGELLHFPSRDQLLSAYPRSMM